MTDETKQEFPPLEVTCPACEGKAGKEEMEWQECYECGVEGKLLTPFGEAVLDLMKRNFSEMLRRAVS